MIKSILIAGALAGVSVLRFAEAHDVPKDAFSGKVVTVAQSPLSGLPGKELIANLQYLAPGTVVPFHSEGGTSFISLLKASGFCISKTRSGARFTPEKAI
jgi:hypothetical protein